MTISTPAVESTPMATERRPNRLRLRRRLLIWSAPVLVVLLLLAFKLGSVGILGNQLPGQFAAADRAAMDTTLGRLSIGSLGPGSRELLAEGDALALGQDVPGATEQFRRAHEQDPAACPPRANYALSLEILSNREVRAGNFGKARGHLAPAFDTATGDEPCFATSTSRHPDLRQFVGETPQRLRQKLAALDAGAFTMTPDGYDYIRAPGGGIDLVNPEAAPCPFPDDDARMRDCIGRQDAVRAQQTAAAQQAEQAEQQAPAPAPGQAAPPPAPTPVPVPAPPSDDPPQFPGGPTADGPAFCKPDGTPLGELRVLLCDTSGPLS